MTDWLDVQVRFVLSEDRKMLGLQVRAADRWLLHTSYVTFTNQDIAERESMRLANSLGIPINLSRCSGYGKHIHASEVEQRKVVRILDKASAICPECEQRVQIVRNIDPSDDWPYMFGPHYNNRNT